ncbi:hypothetical protein [Rheinheimera texasensis]|uniref:hypothetical protein n=1 Tax=Rheinheimera texasensis TaxID=306205 RepID=UPI0032B14842
MMNFRLIFAISLFAAIQSIRVSATTILCDGCNTAAMLESAKVQAARRMPGVYTIDVLNLTGADYSAYKATVAAGGQPGAPLIAISQQTSAKEAQIEAAATDFQLAIHALQKTAAEKIVLPAHSPYPDAAVAKAEKTAFATYTTHVVRSQHQALQQNIATLNASLRHLATMVPVEYVDFVASASLQSPIAVETWVVFPDQTEINVQMTLQYNLADGLVPLITVIQ